MEKIDEHLNKLRVVDTPKSFHQGVMQKVYNWRFRTIFFVVFFILLINFIIITLHIDIKLINAEFADMFQDLMGSFDMSITFFNVIFDSLFDIVSPFVFFSAFISLIGVFYVGRKIYISKFLI